MNVDPNMHPSCPFCTKVLEGSTTVVEESFLSTVHHFEPLNPVTQGHRLFIWGEHIIRYDSRGPVAMGEVYSEAIKYAQKQLEDFNLIMSAGPSATQTVDHLHVHYVPRRAEDGFSLPWTVQEEVGTHSYENPSVRIVRPSEGGSESLSREDVELLHTERLNNIRESSKSVNDLFNHFGL